MSTPVARVLDRRHALLETGRLKSARWGLVGVLLCSVLCPTAWAQSAIEGNTSDIAARRPADEGQPGIDLLARPGEPLDLSFDDLKFDIEKGADFQRSMLTEAVKELEGQTIRIRGFVRPGFKQSGIKSFVLVRDNQECCFGPGAALYDCVMVKMAEGMSIDFTVRPICVVGTMQLKEFVGKDKKVWAIFRLNETRME